MMEINNRSMYGISNLALLKIIGDFLQKTRLQQNKTQQEVAEAAGVNRSTIMQIEKGGGGTLLTFIQILRALEQLPVLKHFEMANQISPLELAKIERKKRKRASKHSSTQDPSKSTW